MQKIKEYNRKEIVGNVLEMIGVSKHKFGYLYLTAFITKVWDENDENPRPLNIYGNEIAEQGGLFIGHMYSAMNYAIEEAWFLGNFRILDYIFGYSLETVVTDSPTPNKFISGIVSVLNTLESNHSDILAFFRFVEQGGYTITRTADLHYASKY